MKKLNKIKTIIESLTKEKPISYGEFLDRLVGGNGVGSDGDLDDCGRRIGGFRQLDERQGL